MAKLNYTLSRVEHETLAAPRSPQWDEVRDKYLSKHNKCMVCGSSDNLQIHHIFPVSYIRELSRPELELEPKNFMTLCESEENDPAENHHILIGHLGNFSSMNEHAVADVKRFSKKTSTQIKTSGYWKAEKASRPKPANKMTKAEREHITKLIEKKFGKKK